MTPSNKGTVLIPALVAALVGALVAGGVVYLSTRAAKVDLSTPYQAILLNNGSAYFGRLEGLGTAYPVLREVYYVQSHQNADKQVVNVLVKRGKEWHSPDRMILNPSTIVFVEPVSPGSRVAQLITEAKNQ